MTDAWAAVMAGLRGSRLALYAKANEQILRGITTAERPDADWLLRHFFLIEISPGTYRARPHMDAAELYAEQPPTARAESRQPTASVQAINDPGLHVRVHTHQLSFL